MRPLAWRKSNPLLEVLMQQALTSLAEERKVRTDAAHMERMRRKAAANREARAKQAERERIREAKRQLAEAERTLKLLHIQYDRALKHPQMKGLEQVGAR